MSLPFRTTKTAVRAARGMVVTNHPLASAAGATMLAAGGTAGDAAAAALFTLSVVEPMMTGLLGGGLSHIRDADGTHIVLDGMSRVPDAGWDGMFTPLNPDDAMSLEAEGRRNAVGPLAVGTPANAAAWCALHARLGRLPLAEVLAPAIHHAAAGFRPTPYLIECIRECAADLAADPAIAAVFLPDGAPPDRLVQNDAAAVLRAIAAEGPGTLHGGPIGTAVADAVARAGGVLSAADVARTDLRDRAPVRGSFHGLEVLGPPPPSAGGVHVVQMLNILERFDLAGAGFGSVQSLHWIAEAMRIAFADRRIATGDPDFVAVPVGALTDKATAARRAAAISAARSQTWGADMILAEGAHTTHVTIADADGRIVCATQTINSLFGARFMIPGTGLIPNNYMVNFDPRRGTPQSVTPGKRVTTSMAPLIALRDGKPFVALGLPGGLRIFPAAMQAILALEAFGMELQQAVEAPRIWTQGGPLEVEPALMHAIPGLRALGHDARPMPHVGGGMNAIRFHEDGTLEGAACWRADGTPIGIGGGLAAPGIRFWPDGRPPAV